MMFRNLDETGHGATTRRERMLKWGIAIGATLLIAGGLFVMML